MGCKTAQSDLERNAGSRTLYGMRYRLLLSQLLVLAVHAGAPLTVDRPFGSDMVWPAGQRILLRGTAEKRQAIDVEYAGVVRRTQSGPDGRWQLDLDPIAPSITPFTLHLRVADGSSSLQLTNLLAGEVWLATGQSNMRMPVRETGMSGTLPGRCRILILHEAADGDKRRYTPEQRAALNPDSFATGCWTSAEGELPGEASAVAASFLQARAADHPDRAIGLIQFAVGGAPIEAFLPRSSLARVRPELLASNWLDQVSLGAWCRERARFNLGPALYPAGPQGPAHPFQPGFLWSCGLEPLAPFPLTGLLWYQGESNAEEPDQVPAYAPLFREWIDACRTAFGARTPFLFVQLPGMNRPHWPAFREMQRRVIDPASGIDAVVTIDLGSRTDVHPRDKEPVGQRLAGLARYHIDHTTTADRSPFPRRALGEGSIIRVEFEDGQQLMTRDGLPVRGFERLGTDGVFRATSARIEGATLCIDGPAERIRYAWTPFPDPPVNLVNQSGLPASPFELEVTGR